MIIGILSDTHGSVKRTAGASALLLAAGVEAVVHCGDIGGESVLLELVTVFDPAAVPVHCVLGNVDLWDDSLTRFPVTTCVQFHGAFADVSLAGKRIAVVHGHEAHRLTHATQSGDFDYVFTGHTHRRDDHCEGNTRVINPGAVHRSAEPSAAVLDLANGTLTYLSIRSEP